MNELRFGKYRGTVKGNADSKGIGRLQVEVPNICGTGQSCWVWAMPCVPYAGRNVGFFMIPPVDAHVWVEFEGGDTRFPIWSGCFWQEGEIPVNPAIAGSKVLKTEVATITIDDTQGGSSLKIEMPNNMVIQLSSSGVVIKNGGGAQIELSGTQVKINEGALEVT